MGFFEVIAQNGACDTVSLRLLFDHQVPLDHVSMTCADSVPCCVEGTLVLFARLILPC